MRHHLGVRSRRLGLILAAIPPFAALMAAGIVFLPMRHTRELVARCGALKGNDCSELAVGSAETRPRQHCKSRGVSGFAAIHRCDQLAPPAAAPEVSILANGEQRPPEAPAAPKMMRRNSTRWKRNVMRFGNLSKDDTMPKAALGMPVIFRMLIITPSGRKLERTHHVQPS